MGTILNAVGANDNWYIVEVENKKGWVSKDWVTDK